MSADDAADRVRARFELGRNVIVSAGAGTGKTTLLTDRILYSLLAGGPKGTGVPIERLVALTFTNKAAGEIKQRLSSRLSDILIHDRLSDMKRKEEAEERLTQARERLGRSEAQVLEAAQKAVSNMDRAMIGTIHHFAARVLKRYPLEAGVDPGFEVDMGEGLADLFETEWRRWLAVELGPGAPREAAWLEVLRLASLEDMRRLAFDLCQEKVRFENVGASPAMKARAREVAASWRPLSRIEADPGTRSKIREYLARIGPRLSGLADALEEDLPIPEEREFLLPDERAWPVAWNHLPGEAEYQACSDLAQATSGLQESLARKAVALVLPFARSLRELYRRRGLVSNDGLILGVWGLILEDSAVREELKSSCDCILIDEFQDTDPIQGELLLLLAEKRGSCARSWREVVFEPGKLFIVGDPKQSIYRFRGADMRAYDGFKGLLKAQGAQTCRLRRSFRSHAGIVEPVNALFSQLMKKSEGLQAEYVGIIAAASPEGDEARTRLVLFHDAAGGRKLKADDSREAEARWIADWIDCRRDARHPFKDVALLLRKTSSVEIYLQALKERGIPYAVEADKYFYGAQEVLDFTNLLRVLDDPDDRLAVVGLMRSPLLGLSDQEIYALAQAKSLTFEKASPDFERMASRLRSFVGKEPLDAFVSRVLDESFLLELCAAAYHHEQTAANLGKYRRLARSANEARGATLKEFIAQVLRSMEDDTLQEGESALADEQFDAVRILSIHKAKGLEYGTVFVADMGAQMGRGGGDKASCRVDWETGRVGLRLNKAGATDLAMTFIEADETARSEAEALRLLYVAVTRAKDRVFLLGSARPGGTGSFSEFLSRVGAWPAKSKVKGKTVVQAPESFLPDEKLGLGCELVDLSKGMPGAGRKSSRPRPAAAELDGSALGAAWRARYDEGKRLSASHVFTSPTAYLKEAEKTSLPEEGIPAGRPRGNAAFVGELCHRVLERWDYAAAGDLEALLRQAKTVLSCQHPLASWDELSAEAFSDLMGFLATPAAKDV
ncbi:MAG: UvrD-helicase domain-containing protein [Elusimicrobiota bacterium]